MVLKGRYDLQISTSSGAARQAYVEAVDAILSATGNVESALDKSINADPNFGLVYSAKARILQLKGKMPMENNLPRRQLSQQPMQQKENDNTHRFSSHLQLGRGQLG